MNLAGASQDPRDRPHSPSKFEQPGLGGFSKAGVGEGKHNSNTPDPKGSVDDGKRSDALGVSLALS